MGARSPILTSFLPGDVGAGLAPPALPAIAPLHVSSLDTLQRRPSRPRHLPLRLRSPVGSSPRGNRGQAEEHFVNAGLCDRWLALSHRGS
jgi:hypothetical protein